jgi:hypothetical protein
VSCRCGRAANLCRPVADRRRRRWEIAVGTVKRHRRTMMGVSSARSTRSSSTRAICYRQSGAGATNVASRRGSPSNVNKPASPRQGPSCNAQAAVCSPPNTMADYRSLPNAHQCHQCHPCQNEQQGLDPDRCKFRLHHLPTIS